MISVETDGGVSSWASVFNLGNCAIGAGILSFPYAISCAGVLGGVLLCLLIAVVEGGTLRLLMWQSTKHQAESYQGLVRTVLGKRYAEFMAWIIVIYLFGSCVAYLIIIGDTFGPLARQYVIVPLSAPLWLADRRPMILITGLTVILPLSLQRTMGALAGTSSLAIVVMIFTMTVVVYESVTGLATRASPFAHVELLHWGLSTFKAVPIMVFAYHCHVQAVPIYAELTEEPTLLPCLPRAAPPDDSKAAVLRRQLRGMYDVVSVSFAECTALYLAVGLAGYALFPDTTSSNILNNFSNDSPLIQLTRFLVGWAVVFHYPINQHVARIAVYDLVDRYAKLGGNSSHMPYSTLAALTLFFFGITTTTACLVTDLGIVFHIMGGVAGSLLIFVLPGALMYRQACCQPGEAVVLSFVDVLPAGEERGPRLLADEEEGGVRGPRLLGADGDEDASAAAVAAGHEAVANGAERKWVHKAVGVGLVALGVTICSLTLYVTYIEMAMAYTAAGAPTVL